MHTGGRRLCLLRRQIRRSARLPEADHFLFPAVVGKFPLLSLCCMAQLFAGEKYQLLLLPYPDRSDLSKCRILFRLCAIWHRLSPVPLWRACHRPPAALGQAVTSLWFAPLLSRHDGVAVFQVDVGDHGADPGRQFFTPLFLPEG